MNIALGIAVISLLLAAFFRILERASGRTPAWHGTIALWLGLVAALAAMMMTHGQKTSMAAGFSLPLAVQIAGFILAGICAWLEWRSGEIFFSLFVLPVAAALFGLAALVEKLLLGSHFSGPWFFFHVGFSIAGECLFFMAALAGATYLFALKRLKEKNRVRAVSFFPPLLRLEKLMIRFLNGGSSLFAIGLTAGFVWSWLQFAVFDPLEPKKGLSTLILLGFGGVSVATRMGHLSGPRVAWCVIGGFLLSMLVMIGIDSSMHWYPK